MKALREIAVVQVGYTFRSPPASMATGDVAVIQPKNLSPENKVDIGSLARVEMDVPKEHHLVKPGDLVFRSRGMKYTYTSAILDEDPGAAVIAAPLFRIRVSDDRILPEYLNWLIRQPPAQSFLAGQAKGTMQLMISKEALESLEVPIPSLERQRAIVTLASLGETEQALMNHIATKRQRMISAQLIDMTKGE